jgi:hypothetical protein
MVSLNTSTGKDNEFENFDPGRQPAPQRVRLRNEAADLPEYPPFRRKPCAGVIRMRNQGELDRS